MNYRTECLEIKNIYDKSEGNNMRLIDADALMRVYQEVLCPHVSCADCSFLMDDGNCRFEKMIREAPTIDAVPVIRCRECLCYTPVDDNIGKCVFLTGKHQYVVPDGYCYLEELKEGVDNG